MTHYIVWVDYLLLSQYTLVLVSYNCTERSYVACVI